MRSIAVLAVLVLATPAAAQPVTPSEALLECPGLNVTPSFRDKLADAMLRESPANDALFEQLVKITQDCGGRFGLSEDKGEAYFTYSLSRLPRDTLVARLAAKGIAAATIDDAFDFGEGRRNPVITGDFSPEQMAGLLAALTSTGVNVETLPDASWEMIGAYTATSSLMWQARRKLN